jgi:multicomponent Na+:H+ antiporter subunit D
MADIWIIQRDLAHQCIILAVIVPFLMGLIVQAVGWFYRKACFPLTVIALTLCTICSFEVLISVIQQGGPIHYYMGGWPPPWGIEYVIDHLNALMMSIVSFIGLVAAIYSKKSIDKEIEAHKHPQYYALTLLFITGLIGITETGDAFNLYVLLEIASITCYALIAMGEDGAPLASFRYVLMGTIGATVYLLGVGYLYIVTGSLNMANLSELLPPLLNTEYKIVIITGFILMMIGLFIKMAFFPLHWWLVNAYTKAPSSATTFIAPLMTKVMAYVMVRVMFTIFGANFCFDMLPTTGIITWVATFAILYGGVMAFSQTDFKRMISYIVISEVGYIVGGVAVANSIAMKGAILHILNDVFMTACAFAVAGMVMYRVNSHNIADFKGIFREMPWTAAVFIVGALAIIGIPPTCGFFSKWYLLLGGIDAGHWEFVIALILCSLINAVLFFRIIETGYYSSKTGENHAQEKGQEAPLSMIVPAWTIVIVIFLIGIFNQPIIENVIKFAVPAL